MDPSNPRPPPLVCTRLWPPQLRPPADLQGIPRDDPHATNPTSSYLILSRPISSYAIHVPAPQFRPLADLKDTLLHEMIHALLFLDGRWRADGDHGPIFKCGVCVCVCVRACVCA